jgi:hypothetical protein
MVLNGNTNNLYCLFIQHITAFTIQLIFQNKITISSTNLPSEAMKFQSYKIDSYNKIMSQEVTQNPKYHYINLKKIIK